MAQNDYRGLEYGVLQWAPPPKLGMGFPAEQTRLYAMKTATHASSYYHSPSIQGRENSRSMHGGPRRRQQPNRTGGPGMQAIFLSSKDKSTGTGFFLPRRPGGIDPKFISKPAVSHVLLPSRVLHALNLNVRELGQQIKPRQGEPKNGVKNTDEKSKNNNGGGDDVCLSPEIYLPEEWTY